MKNIILNEKPDDGVCRYCRNPRKADAKTGRPRIFCNVLCRQVASWEIKWHERRIEGREANLAAVRTDPQMVHFINVEREEAELDRLYRALAALVAG